MKPPTEPFHVKLEQAGHKLIRDEDGDVDIFICDTSWHNGPGCELCGESWCQHCDPVIEPCSQRGEPTEE
jgi:hypothetical protein